MSLELNILSATNAVNVTSPYPEVMEEGVVRMMDFGNLKSFSVYMHQGQSPFEGYTFISPRKPIMDSCFEHLFGFGMGCDGYSEDVVVRVSAPCIRTQNAPGGTSTSVADDCDERKRPE